MARDIFGQQALEGQVRAGDKRQFKFGEQTYKEVLAEVGPKLRSGLVLFENFMRALSGRSLVSPIATTMCICPTIDNEAHATSLQACAP